MDEVAPGMMSGPMSDVWVYFGELANDFSSIVATIGVVLLAAGAFYTMWIAWRKYRTATSRI